MITTDILYRGEDKTEIFILKDCSNNLIVFEDLVDCEAIVVVNKVVQQKYSKEEKEGYLTLLPVEDEENKCKLILTSAMTSEFPKGLMEIMFTMSLVDADYPVLGRKETVEMALYIVE